MRSKWKGIFIHVVLYKFANTKFKNFGPNWLSQKANIRSSVYIKKLISRSIFVHNGLSLINFKLYNHDYIGIKIGQFTYNRLLPAHSLNTYIRIKANLKILAQRGKLRSKYKRSKLKAIKEVIV